MIKAAIEKIESMTRPQIQEVDGVHYAIDKDGDAKQIRPVIDKPETVSLSSLEAMVQMVKHEALDDHIKVFIEVCGHEAVKCFTLAFNEMEWQRWNLYTAKAIDVPGWGAEESFPFEKAAIALQTRFQETADLGYTLQLLSQITTGAKVTYNDIGVATTVVSQKGISLQQNQTIKPVVTLKPYRTFQEVEQPDGRFLIRISERGISFIEADGGMWKLAARKTVKAYLEDALRNEIEAGSVVVML